MASYDASPRYLNEPASVPADHQDPNHPHYPVDLEHQLAYPGLILGKKSMWIIGGIMMTCACIITAIIALTRNYDNIVPTNTSTPAPLEIQTVFESATTFVYTTTRVPLIVVPSLATSTVLLPPTVRAEVAPEAPLRPTLDEPSSAIATSGTPVPTNVETGDTLQSEKCLFDGAWALKEQCEKHCPAWEGHSTHCEVSKRSQWVCVSCSF